MMNAELGAGFFRERHNHLA